MLHRTLEVDSCEHGNNEPSGSIKGRQFIDKLSDPPSPHAHAHTKQKSGQISGNEIQISYLPFLM